MAFDLNLLRVFDALMQERKVAAAADRLGLSAPALSNALARLRRATGDELFTRTPHGMQPTPRALAMAATLADALARIEASLGAAPAFDPAASTRHFRLAMTDIGEIVFLPTLMRELPRLAPAVTLATVRGGTVDLREAMADGRVDLAIGWLPDLDAGFHKRRLFDQRYVALMAAGHPLARGRLTAARFATARHAIVHAQGTGHERVERLLAGAGVARPTVLQLPHFVAVPHIVAASDLVATVPHKLAERVAAPFGLVLRELPLALPRFAVDLLWHRRVHQDGGNRWLREQLARWFGEG
jgi:DNA-binding transcriptional LysR family regulator